VTKEEQDKYVNADKRSVNLTPYSAAAAHMQTYLWREYRKTKLPKQPWVTRQHDDSL